MTNMPFKDAKTLARSVQPIAGEEKTCLFNTTDYLPWKGQHFCKASIFLSNMCLCFYIFTNVQYAIHCKKDGSFQVAWSQSKEKFSSRYSSNFKKCMSQTAFSCAKCVVSLQVFYCFQEGTATTLEGKIWIMPGNGLDSAVGEGVFQGSACQICTRCFWKAIITSKKKCRTFFFRPCRICSWNLRSFLFNTKYIVFKRSRTFA